MGVYGICVERDLCALGCLLWVLADNYVPENEEPVLDEPTREAIHGLTEERMPLLTALRILNNGFVPSSALRDLYREAQDIAKTRK